MYSCSWSRSTTSDLKAHRFGAFSLFLGSWLPGLEEEAQAQVLMGLDSMLLRDGLGTQGKTNLPNVRYLLTDKNYRSDVCYERWNENYRSDVCNERWNENYRSDVCYERWNQNYRSDVCYERWNENYLKFVN